MKIRISLLMMFAFAGVFEQLNSMQDYTIHFKRLGIKPTARLTSEDVKVAHKKAIKSIKKVNLSQATQLNIAKHRLEDLCLVRARSRKTYSKEIILREKAGAFTENIWYIETDPIDKLNCSYMVCDYNYKEIFKAFLIAGALVNAGIFCLYRDRIESSLAKFF